MKKVMMIFSAALITTVACNNANAMELFSDDAARTQLNNLIAYIGKLEKKLEELISTNTKDISRLSSDQERLSQRLDAVEEARSRFNSELKDENSKLRQDGMLASNQNRTLFNSMQDNIKVLQEEVKSKNEAIEVLSGKIERLTEEMETLKSSIERQPAPEPVSPGRNRKQKAGMRKPVEEPADE